MEYGILLPVMLAEGGKGFGSLSDDTVVMRHLDTHTHTHLRMSNCVDETDSHRATISHSRGALL